MCLLGSVVTVITRWAKIVMAAIPAASPTCRVETFAIPRVVSTPFAAKSAERRVIPFRTAVSRIDVSTAPARNARRKAKSVRTRGNAATASTASKASVAALAVNLGRIVIPACRVTAVRAIRSATILDMKSALPMTLVNRKCATARTMTATARSTKRFPSRGHLAMS